MQRKKKRKTYEVLAEAIELYKMLDEIEHIDPKHLVVATMFLERQLELAIKIIASASSLFTSELVQSMMEAYNKIDQARAHAQPASQQGSGLGIDVRSILLPLVTQLLQNIISTLPKSQAQQHSGVAGVKIIE